MTIALPQYLSIRILQETNRNVADFIREVSIATLLRKFLATLLNDKDEKL